MFEEEVDAPIDVIKNLTFENIDYAIKTLPAEEAIPKVHALIETLLEQVDYDWRRG
ncbi:hypothetical protein K6V78_02065 [Streptococcus gallolyticus]|nr:hypothetical protein [Streptococcus gallolyticus]MBY5040424.1 hypothetical protein [Streptococcus gallolyticus]